MNFGMFFVLNKYVLKFQSHLKDRASGMFAFFLKPTWKLHGPNAPGLGRSKTASGVTEDPKSSFWRVVLSKNLLLYCKYDRYITYRLIHRYTLRKWVTPQHITSLQFYFLFFRQILSKFSIFGWSNFLTNQDRELSPRSHTATEAPFLEVRPSESWRNTDASGDLNHGKMNL